MIYIITRIGTLCLFKTTFYGTVLLFILAVSKLYSFELTISRYEMGLQYQPEYNRIFHYCWDVSTFGAIELNNRFVIKTGLAMGQIGTSFVMRTFLSSEVALPIPIKIPLFAGFSYKYKTIPDYYTGIHSLLPTISIKGKWAGISLGSALRFTAFADDPVIFEPIIALSAFVNIFYTELLRIGIICANYNDFKTGNMGSYALSLNIRARITKIVSLTNALEVSQTGSVGLASNLYGITYRGCVVLQW